MLKQPPHRFQKRAPEARKATGSHYTPVRFAEFVAEAIAGHLESNGAVTILDPAVGDGELLAAFLRRWPERVDVFGFDTDVTAIERASLRLAGEFPRVSRELNCIDFLDVSLADSLGDLFCQAQRQYDAVIANPPYVRTQVLGASRAQAIARRFGLTGRVDLYFAFIEGIGEVLRPGGVAGIIVSNRFMTTKFLHVW